MAYKAAEKPIAYPSSNLLALAITGANLLAVIPLAYTLWIYSQVLPKTIPRINP